MKKRIQALVLILSFLFSLTGCSSRPSSSLTSVSVWESSHSVFYAPQYAAMELGYFEEEGIHIALPQYPAIRLSRLPWRLSRTASDYPVPRLLLFPPWKIPKNILSYFPRLGKDPDIFCSLPSLTKTFSGNR